MLVYEAINVIGDKEGYVYPYWDYPGNDYHRDENLNLTLDQFFEKVLYKKRGLYFLIKPAEHPNEYNAGLNIKG